MGALDGIRVLEAGLLIQGPQAAATLHDWGAEVIKVELPGIGDQARWVIASPEDLRSPIFIACNRGKRSVTLDLRVDDGRDAFLRLADTVDVVITNFKPGTMYEWGLGYDVIAARNPRVVYAAGSTFGPEGPDATREGADLSAQAAGGLISTTGADGEPPTPVGVAIADHTRAEHRAACWRRCSRGNAQAAGSASTRHCRRAGGRRPASTRARSCRPTPGRSTGATRWCGRLRHLPTADGWLGIIGATGPTRDALYEVLGRPDLIEAFPQLYYWADERAALFPLIGEAMSARSTAEWCERFTEAGIRWAPVRDYHEVIADRGMWTNGYFLELESSAMADGAATSVVGTPVRFSDTPSRAAADAPELGQHTEEVLLEIGYTWDEIAHLQERGAI
jgi:crotonobetainyl-CoA:carnitine CoA-transferase CaiB-like acyl-CoA transferase